jgi:hypothetical protein
MFLNMSFQQRRPRLSDTMVGMWRMAEPADDDSMVELCRALYDEDPGLLPVPPANMRATLEELRRNPHRGRAVVLEIQKQLAGYAFAHSVLVE